jgi:PAS domain S-box-containing protein
MGLLRILIVDDHEGVLRGVRAVLSSRSEWVICGEARDGLEAVEKAMSLRPDVVLMDISMPRMNGVEATRIIRQEVPESVVILISQNDPHVVARQAAEVDARAYVAKSDISEQLLAAVDKVAAERTGSKTRLDPGEIDFPEKTSSAATDSREIAAGNIAERMHAEANSLLAAIVDSSDDAIISKGIDGIITSWNKAAERMFGHTAKEAIGKHITLIIPADRRDEEAGIIQRLRRGERLEHFETIRVRKDGTEIEISLTISPVKDRSGSIVGASKVARDITERRRSERALRESEERFRAIVETTPECVKLVGIDGTLLHMNPPGLAMVGATCPEMVLGKNVYDIIAAHDREKFRIFNEDVCHGKRGTLEFDIVGLDGVGHHMETHAAPMTMSNGSVVQLAVTSDITERVRVQERLRRSEEQLRTLADDLEKQVRARTQELEARNTEVLQQSELLRELSNRLLQTQDDERRHIARELHDSAGQIIVALGMNLASMTPYVAKLSVMDKTVEDSQNLIKQLSREIRTTSYLLHPPLLDENGLPEAIRWYVEGLMERSGLSIKLDIAEDFGRIDSETELAMFRIVQECLTNIHRHSGSKTAKIRLSRNAASVSLEIQDEGKGMAAHKLDGVRAHRSGVGITGMRERVRHLNGAMDINSNAKGTKISVKLPVSENDISQPGNIGQEHGLEMAG